VVTFSTLSGIATNHEVSDEFPIRFAELPDEQAKVIILRFEKWMASAVPGLR
jgi:hypothetical protein